MFTTFYKAKKKQAVEKI